jgi:hypothetical protein
MYATVRERTEGVPVSTNTAPPAARALSTLSRIDYQDSYLVETGVTLDRTAEEFARMVLEGAPAITRGTLRRAWTALGLKLGPDGSERFVLGWEIRRSTPDHVLLGADSRIGMPAELFLERRDDALQFCTFVHHGNPIARAMWAGVEPIHPPTVRRMLEDAAVRIRTMERAAPPDSMGP